MREAYGRGGDAFCHAEDIRLETQEILKEEWERVKAGEPIYTATLRISRKAGIVAGILLTIYVGVWGCCSLILPSAMWFISLFKG
jgi:hypothetical protein